MSERDRRVEALSKQVLENAGHQNVTVRTVKYAEGGPPTAGNLDSAGTWSMSSNSGSFSFSLSVDEYNHASDAQIEAAILRALTEEQRIEDSRS